MHRMYMIAGLIFLLMVGSFGISSNDLSEETAQYGNGINGIDMHAANAAHDGNDGLADLLASGVISEVDKQTSANGIRR